MTAQRAYHLRCDVCGENFVPSLAVYRTGPVREEAARAGWTYRIDSPPAGGPGIPRDVCGKHSGEPVLEFTVEPEVRMPAPLARYALAVLESLMLRRELVNVALASLAIGHLRGGLDHRALPKDPP